MNMRPAHVSVLIPAQNEEKLLPLCLRSVKKSLSALPAGVTSDLVVVVDRSTDRTWEIASEAVQNIGAVVRTNAGAVGEARSLAATAALERYHGPRHRCWLANTDADCVVPANWLSTQLALAAAGIDAIAGAIDVIDFEGHSSMVEERFRRTYLIGADGSHAHVHGANLGFRADVYLQAGGWRDLVTGEDHDLWARLSQLDARRASVSDPRVITSGRRVGRAPRGFAAALAAHNENVA